MITEYLKLEGTDRMVADYSHIDCCGCGKVYGERERGMRFIDFDSKHDGKNVSYQVCNDTQCVEKFINKKHSQNDHRYDGIYDNYSRWCKITKSP